MGESLKKILVMAGGTGGHVFPALMIAKKLQADGAQVYWLGTRRGLEAELVPQASLPIYYISVAGIRRTGVFNLLMFPLQMFIACSQVLFIFLKVKPNCVLGMGGFVSGPGGLMAWLLGKPLVIHEQNAVMGMTNKILSKLATKTLLAFSVGLKIPFPLRGADERCQLVGNPVREEIVAIDTPAQRLVGRSGPLRVLVLGGSQGALAINQLVVEALASIPEKDRPEVQHQTGKLHYETTLKTYQDKAVVVKMMPFIEDIAAAYAWADLVICRAGAMTVSELMAAGVASILVPFPFAVDDHQTRNSEQLVQAGAALCIQQRDLSSAVLMQLLAEFNQDRGRLLTMAQAARDLGKSVGDAAEKIAKSCLDAGIGIRS